MKYHSAHPFPFLLFSTYIYILLSNIMRRLFLLVIATLLGQLSLQAQGYQISVKLKNFTGGKFFLAHYMGKSTYLADSAEVSPAGK